MSLGLMLVTLIAAMLATQPGSFVESSKISFQYRTMEMKGVSENAQDPLLDKVKFRARIKSEQCSGRLLFTQNYLCKSPLGPYLPNVLKVQVLDNTGPAEVFINGDLRYANIYRVAEGKPQCKGPAIVLVSLSC